MVNFVLWVVLGGFIGWIASLVMDTDRSRVFVNMIVGILGAFLAGWLLTPLFGFGTINQDDFSVAALFLSFLGACMLLATIRVFRRSAVR